MIPLLMDFQLPALWENPIASAADLRQAALLVQILLLRGKSSPDVALGFVQIQYLPCFHRQCGIDLHETLCHVLMYRAFAHPESLGCLSDGRVAVDDIVCDADGTLFDIILQRNTPVGYFLLLYEGFRRSMTKAGLWQHAVFPLPVVHLLNLPLNSHTFPLLEQSVFRF